MNPFRSGGFGHGGLQRQRVQLAADAPLEGLVDELVLLHAALALEGGGNDVGAA